MDRDTLRRHLEFYRDLGIRDLLVDAPSPAPALQPQLPAQVIPPAPTPANPRPSLSSIPPPKQMTPPLIPIGPDNDTLDLIRQDMGDCKRCRLCEGRNQIVFGSGNAQARLVFVGEGPGADEDAQGIPFVGRAGQLLTQMIDGTASKEGIAIRRGDVYIANVVKCRPPKIAPPSPMKWRSAGSSSSAS
jgi:uracil-DNA glycosylase